MLNEALRFIRIYHSLKQNEAAKKLGISKSYLSELEAGEKKPTLQLIESYSKAFDIPTSSILYFSENLHARSSARKAAEAIVAKKALSLLKFLEDHEDDKN